MKFFLGIIAFQCFQKERERDFQKERKKVDELNELNNL